MRPLLQQRVDFGSGHNRNAAKLVLSEARLEHRRAVVDELIGALGLEQHLGLRPGTDFGSVV